MEKGLEYSKNWNIVFSVETTKIENTSFPFKTALSGANIETNRMATTKETYIFRKRWS